MGSSAGWQDVATCGGAGRQRKVARAEAAAAERYAAEQERLAQAMKAANGAQVQAVQASTADPQEAARQQVETKQKRKKSIASLANASYGKLFGVGNGRPFLG